MAHTYIITDATVLGDSVTVNGSVDGVAVQVSAPTSQVQSFPTPATKLGFILSLMFQALPPQPIPIAGSLERVSKIYGVDCPSSEGVMVRARYQGIMIELPTDFELAQIQLYRTVK